MNLGFCINLLLEWFHYFKLDYENNNAFRYIFCAILRFVLCNFQPHHPSPPSPKTNPSFHIVIPSPPQKKLKQMQFDSNKFKDLLFAILLTAIFILYDSFFISVTRLSFPQLLSLTIFIRSRAPSQDMRSPSVCICLRSVSCVQRCLYLWIVHSWLPISGLSIRDCLFDSL